MCYQSLLLSDIATLRVGEKGFGCHLFAWRLIMTNDNSISLSWLSREESTYVRLFSTQEISCALYDNILVHKCIILPLPASDVHWVFIEKKLIAHTGANVYKMAYSPLNQYIYKKHNCVCLFYTNEQCYPDKSQLL